MRAGPPERGSAALRTPGRRRECRGTDAAPKPRAPAAGRAGGSRDAEWRLWFDRLALLDGLLPQAGDCRSAVAVTADARDADARAEDPVRPGLVDHHDGR